MGDDGLEQVPDSPGKTPVSSLAGTYSGTVDGGDTSGFAILIEAWPHLSPTRREAILEIARSALAKAADVIR